MNAQYWRPCLILPFPGLAQQQLRVRFQLEADDEGGGRPRPDQRAQHLRYQAERDLGGALGGLEGEGDRKSSSGFESGLAVILLIEKVIFPFQDLFNGLRKNIACMQKMASRHY